MPDGHLIRLPTEAEWEWAARGPKGLCWPWGDDRPEDSLLANTRETELGRTSAVGLFSPGAPWFADSRPELPSVSLLGEGIHDQAGNVWEWCSSLYRAYPVLAGDGLDDPDAEGPRVVRGGSWGDLQGFARCAVRSRGRPDGFSYSLGFRVVLSLADPGS